MPDATLPRGTVTFLFTDIEDSTQLVRRLGNETFATVRSEQRRLLREAFAAHGGHEIDTAGDGFFVAFHSARDAVRAAVAGQRALAAHAWPDSGSVRVRMGVHTAEPHLADEGYVGVGVHRAARICDAGHGGQILLSSATAGIVEDAELPGVVVTDLGVHRLKGVPLEQRLFHVAAPGLEPAFGPPRTSDSGQRVPGTGTFLFADLVNWQCVVAAVGDEATAALMARYHNLAQATMDVHDGLVLEFIGDSALAVFRSASDALRAAVALRDDVRSVDWPPECKVGVTIAVHSGRWSGNPQQPMAGTALTRLVKLVRTGKHGGTIVSATTAALVDGDRSVPSLRPGDDAAAFELVDAG